MSRSNKADWITIGFTVFLAVLILASARDETYSINTVTGATRTQVRYAFFIFGADRISPTWATESAKRQGISIAGKWKNTGSFRTVLGMKSRGCTSNLPASAELNLLFRNGKVPADQQAEADALLRKFVAEPDETARRYLVWDSMLLNR
ncbi:hypothetical protein JIN85_07020 [Luteolibacter pohnpeiensis]|uniref:Uncharacterized protein n=1 Tax=Luteolibacter pohnpeiensis TaxID=454153 RepID=A0A934VVV4_9BACT|nr:hypothetical protein [Luteolibacter pohnpeiensis]MBK1882158.1 hypothetical protein [Luteolibacter pohnpeiensis]